MPTAKLLSSTDRPMKLLKHACGMCHDHGDVSDKVIDHVVKAGHLSVLEHCTATFEVTCSIVTLMQLTRHRHLSFTVQSSRVCKMDKTHFTGIDEVDEAIRLTMQDYKILTDNGVSTEDCAYLLPKATEYKLVVTGNFRAWFEYLSKRMCRRASKEHRELAHYIWQELREICPEVFWSEETFMKCDNCNEKGCNFT